MSRKLFGITLLVLALGAFSFASANEEGTVETNTVQKSSTETPVRTKTEVKTNIESRDGNLKLGAEMQSSLEARKSLLEEQRIKLIQAAEARKKALEVKKDAAGAVREEMKIKIEEKRAEMDEKREALKEEFEARRASSTARRIEWQQDVAVRKAEHVAKVITATIERLEKIIVRIESRITKVQGQGGDTTEAEGFVAAAKVNLSDAKASVAAFATIDLTSDKAQENFDKVRALAAEAREHIRKAHENMMLAVRSLGAIDKEALPTVTATTTTSTTVN